MSAPTDSRRDLRDYLERRAHCRRCKTTDVRQLLSLAAQNEHGQIVHRFRICHDCYAEVLEQHVEVLYNELPTPPG